MMSLEDYKYVLEQLRGEGIKVEQLRLKDIRYTLEMYKKYKI